MRRAVSVCATVALTAALAAICAVGFASARDTHRQITDNADAASPRQAINYPSLETPAGPAIHPDDQYWQSLESACPGDGFDDDVSCFVEYNGDLIVGGQFTTICGVSANPIVRFDGANWYPLGPGTNDKVLSLTVYNGELIAGGHFDCAGGVSTKNIAQLNGSVWELLGSGVLGSCGYTPVQALTTFNGDLVFGGCFSSAGSRRAYNIAAWNSSRCNTDGIRGNIDYLTRPGGEKDVADLSYLVDYLFKAGPEPPCLDEGKVDGVDGPDGPIDVADLSFLVDYLFRGGLMPPSCL